MELVDSMVAGLADASRSARHWQDQAVEMLLLSPQTPNLALAHLLHRLERAGYGDAVRSWTGSGVGRRISPPQLHAALGEAEVQRLAGRAGLTSDELTAALSQQLPAIVGRQAREQARPRR